MTSDEIAAFKEAEFRVGPPPRHGPWAMAILCWVMGWFTATLVESRFWAALVSAVLIFIYLAADEKLHRNKIRQTAGFILLERGIESAHAYRIPVRG